MTPLVDNQESYSSTSDDKNTDHHTEAAIDEAQYTRVLTEMRNVLRS